MKVGPVLAGGLVAGAIVFLAVEVKDAIPHLHLSVVSTPARGTAQVDSASYQVQTVIPCGSLALVGVNVHVSVATSALFGLLGAHVDATYPERIDVCVGGNLPATATVSKTSVLVSVPVLHPVSVGIDDLSQKGTGGVETAWYQSASTGEVNAVEKTSREVADISAELTPLPAKDQRSAVLAAEQQALPALQREFDTNAIKFKPVSTLSAFDQVQANWRTFGPEIKAVFSVNFGGNGLTVTAKDGSGGTASIGQALTSSQLGRLNHMQIKS